MTYGGAFDPWDIFTQTYTSFVPTKHFGPPPLEKKIYGNCSLKR